MEVFHCNPSFYIILEPGTNGDEVLSCANQLLREEHHITKTTLQVESYQQIMDECGPCQEPERVGVLQGILPKFLFWPKRKAPVSCRSDVSREPLN